MNKLLSILGLLRQGNALANPDVWKDREFAARAVAVFLIAAVQAAKLFGYDIGVDHDTLTAIAGGIAGCVWLFVRTAASPARGIPAPKPADAAPVPAATEPGASADAKAPGVQRAPDADARQGVDPLRTGG
jgi:hypothetical protein